jgi:GGDEF domain-containing protein
MTQKETTRIEGDQVFVLLPKAEYEQMSNMQQRILDILENKTSNLPGIGDFIPKEEAERILGRKGTTLWKLRKEGKIAYSKMGSEVFYSRQSILDYLKFNLTH